MSLVLVSGLPPGGQELSAHMKTSAFAASGNSLDYFPSVNVD